MRTVSIAAALLLCSACAVRRPTDWRLIRKNSSPLLIPPGISNPDRQPRTVAIDVPPGNGACPPGIKRKDRHIVARIDRDNLLSHPPGWLAIWAEQLESQNCIAKGHASTFAAQVAESLPLAPDAAFHLIYPDDLVPPVRLEVVSPILRDPNGPLLAQAEAAGSGSTLNLTVRASDNLIGYETALYQVQAKLASAGFNVTPLYADRHIQQTTVRRAQPATNYFQFPPDAAFYRLFVKSNQTDFTALAITAPTRAELDRIAASLDNGMATCESLTAARCIAIPRRVALNCVIPVTLNGNDAFVRWGADLAEAIRSTGIRQPESLLPTLSISRPYKGTSVPIQFDRSSPAVLRLTLTGGEAISWHH